MRLDNCGTFQLVAIRWHLTPLNGPVLRVSLPICEMARCTSGYIAMSAVLHKIYQNDGRLSWFATSTADFSQKTRKEKKEKEKYAYWQINRKRRYNRWFVSWQATWQITVVIRCLKNESKQKDPPTVYCRQNILVGATNNGWASSTYWPVNRAAMISSHGALVIRMASQEWEKETAILWGTSQSLFILQGIIIRVSTSLPWKLVQSILNARMPHKTTSYSMIHGSEILYRQPLFFFYILYCQATCKFPKSGFNLNRLV